MLRGPMIEARMRLQMDAREAYIVRRIEAIQRELDYLKRLMPPGEGRMEDLYGIWKGADITDDEIEEAKRFLFKGIELDDDR